MPAARQGPGIADDRAIPRRNGPPVSSHGTCLRVVWRPCPPAAVTSQPRASTIRGRVSLSSRRLRPSTRLPIPPVGHWNRAF